MRRIVSPTMLVALGLLGVSGCATLEGSLLYHPTKTKAADSPSFPSPLQDVELHTADGMAIHARWCPHLTARGAVLYCPGNAGNLDLRARLVKELGDAL